MRNMKKPKKMKLISEIIEKLRKDGKEITHESVSSWVMTQMGRDAYNEARYGSLKQGDFALYFREHYVKETQ